MRPLGAILGPAGSLVELSWGRLSSVLSPLGAILGSYLYIYTYIYIYTYYTILWGPLGSSWGSLLCFWESCGTSGRPWGGYFSDLGALLGLLGALSGFLGGVLGGAGVALEAYKRRLGGFLGRPGDVLEAWSHLGHAQEAPRNQKCTRGP